MNAVQTEAEILDDLRGIFRDALGVDPVAPIEPSTRFFADLGLASIDAVVLGEAIQAHLGRPLPFDAFLAELGRREQRDLLIAELVAFLRDHS
ncbi:acyl carrier protein [Aquisphaera giovannonii]|uniref:Acyl carrier protein n=1 Tax=Aquisphaera giovannonii TaxID=406548 RepID=A0A5B9VWK3_9BACT|nr:acyl carrier protein [Aquisphaera giovannonii]QEH32612.1 acyl carrier protein [Aquisphaera giovannonii]